ncbi:methyltransferase type 11 [Marinobacter psychrophilus]|uniref:Methyltransferase type 11 n=1 Tax=Marinobacter psychrophilus TaxID=330734 RepID=A0A0H4ICD4_9GAMM|nr:class I SAM-dependent methyltransferase [Marinobacter psychrophilus]AKO52692.1 methyltransferase type 11 [Marinobacter psychrophilus]
MKLEEAIDYQARHDSFEQWFQTPLGRALLADQRQYLDHKLASHTGARQLQVGVSHRLPLATGTDFLQRIITVPQWHSDISGGVAVCDADELPFPGDSMDLVILPHTADFSRFPHQVLRESARVLRGEGCIAITGFNPFSVWGLRRLLSGRFGRPSGGPWGGLFIPAGRMEDWLRLLGFQIEHSVTRFYGLPLQRWARNSVQQQPSGFMPGGAYYCILARKRELARTPGRRAWSKSKVIRLAGSRPVGVARTSHKNDQESE